MADDTNTGTTPAPLEPEVDPNAQHDIIKGMLPDIPGVNNSPAPAAFAQATQQDAKEPALFPTDPQQQSTNRYSENQTTTTAALAALAQQRTGLQDPGTPQGRMESLVALNQMVLQQGQEKMLREQIAMQTKNNLVQQAQKFQSMSIQGDPAFADTKLSDLVNAGIDAQNAPLDENALEKQGVQHLQIMAAQDPDQAAIMTDAMHQGDSLDRIRDNVVKMQIFNREVDALREVQKGQGTLHDVADFVTGFLPFKAFLSQVGNVKDAKTGFWDLPATIQNKEISTLWNMPVDEFAKALPDVFQKFTQQDFGAGQDLTRALQTAQQFGGQGLNQSDSLSFNLWTGADILGFIPLDRMAMVPSKAARLLGNRTASADIVASGLSAEINGTVNAFAGMQAPYHVVEESLPASLVPDTQSLVRADVGVFGDVADRLDQIKAGTDAARKALVTQDRLAPEQLQAAVEDAVNEVKLRFNDDPIADMKSEVVVPDKEPGEFPKVLDTKAPMVLDPEADLDNLSYANARGEIYEPAEVPAKAFPPTNAQHEQAMADIDAEAVRRFNAGETVSGELATKARAQYDRTATTEAKTSDLGGMRGGDTNLSRNTDTGIYTLNFYLGKRHTSGGFITREGAEAAAVRRGFAVQDVGIHQNSDGQWFVKVKQPITETGIATPVLREADFPAPGLLPKPSAILKSADNIMPELFNQSRITQTIGKQKFLSSVVGPWIKNIKSLSTKSIRGLTKVMTVGEREQKWFNINEFAYHFERATGRVPTNKEVLGYYSVKELSDLNYHVFNSNIYAEKARRGMQTITATNDIRGVSIPRQNGRVVANPDFKNLRVFDIDEGVTYPAGTNATELADKYARGGYRVIELEVPHKAPGEDPVKHFMAHEGSSTVEGLEPMQLGYIAGGSRENRFRWFVKQASSGALKDGTTFWENPVTHIASPTRRSAEEWANRMENARQAFFDTEMAGAEKRRIIELSPVESYDKFEQLVAEGTIQRDHPFEVLFDRQTPEAMSRIGERDLRWVDTEQTPEENYAISKGRMYYSKKGERLRDPTGEYAEIMDPMTTLHKALLNSSQTWAFGDYNRKVMEEWSRVASPYIDPHSVGANHSSNNLFYNGTISSDLYRSNPRFANQLENVRNTHKHMMGMQLPEHRQIYAATRQFADWVENKGKWGEKLATLAVDRMSSNPVTAVRGMVFDAKLGFFDPGQLLVQTQTAVLAMSANPIYGARTVAMLKPLIHMMLNRSENLLDYYATRLSARYGNDSIHGLSPSDFKSMVRSLRNSGWMNVGGEMAQLDQYINTIGGSAIARGWGQFREAGRLPFNTAEQFNRITAYSMAWQIARTEQPEALVTRDFLNIVNKKADDLSMNMTSSSAAYWQKGVLSIPTQFLAYQVRVLENILPKVMGGSSRFTGGQKLRMGIGQLLMYGSGGIPLGDMFASWIAQSYADANGGKQLDSHTWRAMSKGFWDTMFNFASGDKMDTDFSHRAGQGQAWTDFYHKLTDGGMNNVLQVVSGPSGAFIKSIWDDFNPFAGKLVRYMQAEQTALLTPDDWEMVGTDVASHISSFSRANKAYWLWKTGTIRDPHSGEIIVTHDKLNALASALGVPLRPENERWDVIRTTEDRNTTVRQMGQEIALVRREAYQAMSDGDEQKSAYYEKLASGLLQAYRDDYMLQAEIANAANKQLGYTEDDWSALVTKTYERTGRLPLGEE